MLDFSESSESLPEMAEVSGAFDRDYDQAEYELKIAGLVRRLLSDKSPENEEKSASWHDAVLRLSDEDHYLLVLIAAAESPNSFITLDQPAVRPSHDRLKLFVTAAAVVFVGIVITVALGRLLR
jgi:hypothetical protein